jgi:site-specific recombinase XerD
MPRCAPSHHLTVNDHAGSVRQTRRSFSNTFSERIPLAVAALNMPISPAVVPATFRRALKTASRRFLPGPVAELHPHLLRHACATHSYERGMTLWEVQKLLGHE